jgi:uncharacterized SAM-binding protein YcdF (DUF218 family)
VRGRPLAGTSRRRLRPRVPRRPLARVLLAVVAAAVLYGGLSFGQVWWASRQDDAQPADAIVVLGAAQYDGVPSPALASRLDHAAELFEQELAPVIVVTGGKQVGDRVTQGMAGFTYLRDAGVPEEALLVEVEGTNTYEELSASANILEDHAMGNEVILVSSAFHAMRLDGIAREVGLQPRVSPVGSAGVADLLKETAGVALGRIIGYRRLSNLL